MRQVRTLCSLSEDALQIPSEMDTTIPGHTCSSIGTLSGGENDKSQVRLGRAKKLRALFSRGVLL